MKHLFHFIILIVGYSTQTIEAQSILSHPIPNLNQLPTNEVNEMHQDKEGFIWFGTTNGLARYDG